MTLNSKLAGARAILEAHNSQSTKPVDVDQFFTNLTEMGGSTEEALAEATWEDLETCGAPRILARKIATLLRGAPEISSQGPTKVIIEDADPEKRAKAMMPKELIEAYDPKHPKSPISLRLKELAEGKRFVVFNDDGSLNTAASLRLFEELDDHGELEEYDLGDGNIVPVYLVGDRPDRAAMEHPLFPGKALRNGRSDCGLDWNVVNLQIAQTLYLAVRETHEIDMDRMSEIDIYEMATASASLTRINRRCMEAAKMFKELQALGNLPSLRIALNKQGKTEKGVNNPFNLCKNRSI